MGDPWPPPKGSLPTGCQCESCVAHREKKQAAPPLKLPIRNGRLPQPDMSEGEVE